MLPPKSSSTNKPERDRRTHVRYPVGLKMPHLRAEVEGIADQVRVGNVSMGGVNLIVGQQLPANAKLKVRIVVPASGYRVERSAQLIYLLPHENCFTAGFAFDEDLKSEELRAIL